MDNECNQHASIKHEHENGKHADVSTNHVTNNLSETTTVGLKRSETADSLHSRNLDHHSCDSLSNSQQPDAECCCSGMRRDCCCVRVLFPSGYGLELKALFSLAWPIILTQACQFFLGPVAVIFSGHLGKTELDAVALSNSMVNALSVAAAAGLGSACDTLFSQTYGSQNLSHMTVLLQRSLMILLLGSIPCSVIQLNATNLLLLMGQDPEVSKLTGEYMTIMVPGLTGLYVYVVLQKYVQSQNIVFPNLLVGGVCNAMNALLHYLLVYVAHMGTRGSAIAQSSSYFMMGLLMVCYVCASKSFRSSWSGFRKESWLDWGQFFQLSFFGLLMVCIEWWAFECCIFLTGLLDTTVQGAQAVVFVLAELLYMPTMGIGIAGSIRVGQFLGAGDAFGAMRASRVALTLSVYFNGAMLVLVVIFKDYLPLAFTNDEEVIELASAIIPIISIYLLFDGITGVCSGIYRGCGRQLQGSIIVFLGYTIGLSVSIPLLLATPLELTGYWIGMSGALVIEGITFLTLTLITNWQREVDKTQLRISSKSKSYNSITDSEGGPGISHDKPHKISFSDDTMTKSDEYTALLASHGSRHNSRAVPVELYPTSLIVKRAAVLVVMALILVIGVICKLAIRADTGTYGSYTWQPATESYYTTQTSSNTTTHPSTVL